MKYLLVSLLFCSSAFADVMNLNEFMPTKLEDATPADEHKTQLQLSSHYEQSHPDQVINRFNPRYGLSKRAHLEASASGFSGGDERGSGRTKLGGLIQLNNPSGHMPMIALMPNILFPTGKYESGIGGELKLALTTTLKGSKDHPDAAIHLNVDHMYHPHVRFDERYNQYLVVIGYSQRLEEGTSIVADYYYQQESKKGKESNVFEVGLQHDLGKNWSYGVGLGAGVGAGPSCQGNFSVAKQF
jgi:hypothetical protein